MISVIDVYTMLSVLRVLILHDSSIPLVCCIEPSLFERGHESFFIDLKEETLLLLLLVIIASPQSRATGGQHASLNLFTNPTAN